MMPAEDIAMALARLDLSQGHGAGLALWM